VPTSIFEELLGGSLKTGGVRAITDIEMMTCASCSVIFGVPSDMIARRRKDGKSFYCPSGHANVFTVGETEEDRLRKKLAAEESRRAQYEAAAREARWQRDHAEKSAAAYKGQVTKIKKRVGNGVCPCCNRQFQNVERHMKTQHPDWSHETHEEEK
jgi:hypothetical protein